MADEAPSLEEVIETTRTALRKAQDRSWKGEAHSSAGIGELADEATVADSELARLENAIAVYGDDTHAEFRASVAMALTDAGAALGKLERFEEAIAVFEDVGARYGEADEPELRALVASALANTGVALVQLERVEEAGEVYDELLARYGQANDVDLRVMVATALTNAGAALGQLQRFEQAIALQDKVITRYGDSTDPALRLQVATALVYKGDSLSLLTRFRKAIAVYNEVVARYGGTTDTTLCLQVATALSHKAGTLANQGRHNDEIVVYDDIVTRYGDVTDAVLRPEVAYALFSKAVTLADLGRSQEAIAVYDDIVTRYGDATDPALRLEVAKALVNKGVRLRQLERGDEAIAAFDNVVSRESGTTDPALRLQMAKALANKGATFHRQERLDQAISVYNDVVARYSDPTDPKLNALLNQVLSYRVIAIDRERSQQKAGTGSPEPHDEPQEKYYFDLDGYFMGIANLRLPAESHGWEPALSGDSGRKVSLLHFFLRSGMILPQDADAAGWEEYKKWSELCLHYALAFANEAIPLPQPDWTNFVHVAIRDSMQAEHPEIGQVVIGATLDPRMYARSFPKERRIEVSVLTREYLRTFNMLTWSYVAALMEGTNTLSSVEGAPFLEHILVHMLSLYRDVNLSLVPVPRARNDQVMQRTFTTTTVQLTLLLAHEYAHVLLHREALPSLAVELEADEFALRLLRDSSGYGSGDLWTGIGWFFSMAKLERILGSVLYQGARTDWEQARVAKRARQMSAAFESDHISGEQKADTAIGTYLIESAIGCLRERGTGWLAQFAREYYDKNGWTSFLKRRRRDPAAAGALTSIDKPLEGDGDR